jgi:hypothetical protein
LSPWNSWLDWGTWLFLLVGYCVFVQCAAQQSAEAMAKSGYGGEGRSGVPQGRDA